MRDTIPSPEETPTGTYYGPQTFRFMANILKVGGDREFYVKQLKYFTPEPLIPYKRFIITIIAAVALIAIYGTILTNSGIVIRYVFPAYLISFIAFVILIFLYILPGRGAQSQLANAIELITFKLSEWFRLRNGHHIQFAIRHIDDDGTIHFNNGDIGYAYHLYGHLGKATLPAAVEQAAASRAAMLTARSATSSEMAITTLTVLDATPQANTHRTLALAAGNDDPFLADLNTKLARLIDQQVHHQSTVVKQTIILRDHNKQALERYVQNYRQAVYGGMASRIIPITDRAALTEALAPLTLYTGTPTT